MKRAKVLLDIPEKPSTAFKPKSMAEIDVGIQRKENSTKPEHKP